MSLGEKREARSQRLGVALDAVADTLDRLTPSQWASPSLCEGWTVKDVTTHLVWRVGSSNAAFAGSLLRASVAGRHISPMRAMDDLARSLAARTSADDLRRQLRLIAEQRSGGHGRIGTGELSEVVVHGYDAAQPCGLRIPFSPDTTELVAHTGARLASPRVRTVLRNRTLVAQDAGWRIGHGSEILADAASIVLFIHGRRALDQTRIGATATVPRPSPLPA